MMKKHENSVPANKETSKKMVRKDNPLNSKRSSSKESITSITSVLSKTGTNSNEVQDKITKIDEVIGDPLLQVTGIKDKDDKSEHSHSDKKCSSTKHDDHSCSRKKKGYQSPPKKDQKTPITWRIDKDVYEKLETKRKKQIRRCLQVQNYQYEHQYVQHKNSIIRLNLATAGIEKSSSELKLFNNQLDQLTEYELMEILKMMSMAEKFKFRRVSKRFRNCINQIIQYETVFALIERNRTINFRIDLITNFSIDPVYMTKGELTSGLVDNINKHMLKLNSIVIAYPIEFDLYLELIRRRSLVNLILSGPIFENKHMNALPDYTVNLSILNLDQCEIDDKGLEVIVRECGKVLNIRLSHCNQITGSFLEHLPSNFACLEITRCEQFKLDSWRLLLTKDRKHMNTMLIDSVPFTGQLVESMTRFDKLTTLDLRFDKSQDYKFRSISMYTRLETLKIADYSNPPSFVDDMFNEIQRGCDRLMKIKFEFDPTRVYLTDAVFVNIAENCAKINSIKLVNCTNLTEKSLTYLSRLKALVELKLDNLTLTDAAIIKPLTDFRVLTKIKLSHCPNITNNLAEQMFKTVFTRSVWYFFALKSNPKITKVDLTHKPPNVIFECS